MNLEASGSDILLISFAAAVTVTWNVMDIETVEPPFDTAAPIPSVAEVIVV